MKSLEITYSPTLKKEANMIKDWDPVKVRKLLSQGWDPNVIEQYGKPPLVRAAEGGHYEAVGILLSAGALPDLCDRVWKRTPLRCATERGFTEVAKLLLKGGANPDCTDAEGWTPLRWAAKHGQEAVAMTLLEGGADPDCAHSLFGNTPLLWAVREGHLKVLQVLIKFGAKKGLDSALLGAGTGGKTEELNLFETLLLLRLDRDERVRRLCLGVPVPPKNEGGESPRIDHDRMRLLCL